MTDAERSTIAEYAGDARAGEEPQVLLDTLLNLRARLVKEQGNAPSEQQATSARLWTFTDHLNASIMESKSQAASILMEMAQRKDESTRLDSKIASLNSLRSKVE